MKKACIRIFRGAIPFLATIILWRLSATFWNPGGILALIPIFFYTFVRPVPWFMPFGMVMCFLIDYKCATVLYWTAMYGTLYAAYGFQNVIDLSQWAGGAVRAFGLVLGGLLMILLCRDFNMTNLARTVWLGVWATALYVPITTLMQRIRHD